MSENTKIDFVIPWVNGTDQAHWQKRKYFENLHAVSDGEDHEQSVGEQRFIEGGEIKYCLRSIINFAPWYNKIYLITDQQCPEFLDAERLAADRIEIIDHQQLFGADEDCLPTFNTRSILTKITNIPDLADIVIIGNDDTFFSKPLSPKYFLQGNLLNVYGEYLDFNDPRFQTLHFEALKHSSRLIHPNAANYLGLSHGFMPLFLSSIHQCEQLFPDEFANNIRYRFRDHSQFLIEALVSSFMLKNKQAQLKNTQDMVHFSFQLCREGTEQKLKYLLSLLASGERTMFCLNDYIALKQRFDWVDDELERLCGEPIKSERTF